MKKFIYKSFLFFAIPMLLGFILDTLISEKLKNSKEFPCENEVWNDIYNSSINSETAIIGSSRAWVHFNPKIINEILNTQSYNFGEDGSNFILQYIRFKEYTSFNPTPKFVVLSLDMWTLKNSDNSYPTYRFYPYMLWNYRVYNILEKFNKLGYKKNLFNFPLIRYMNFKTFDLLLNNNEKPFFKLFNKYLELNSSGNLRNYGFRAMNLEWKKDDIKTLFDKNYSVNIDYSIKLILENFIEELIDNNIEIIMVYPPEFIEGQGVIANRNEILSIYKNISIKLDIPFFDYSNDTISMKKDLFYNVQHLNKTGANLFSRDISFKINEYRSNIIKINTE